MNDRIKRLRQQSLDAVNCISAERALLVTEFYKGGIAAEASKPYQRARLLWHLLKNKTICINEGELIVGERGPAPKATPTYPEICLHTVYDLEILNNRNKVSFRVDKETMAVYEDLITPFWQGKTNRDRIFAAMNQNWIEAYEAGIFTEFQEQRAPGHTVCGEKIFCKGMIDLQNEIDVSIAALDFMNDEKALAKLDELEAMKIASEAVVMFAERHADHLEKMAENEPISGRKEELLRMANVCRNVPANAPSDFHEALQYYWFVHLAVITELNPWDSFNPGRLDQHLYPFYRNGIDNGSLTKEKAIELLQAFWIKFNNHPSPPKVGITALESNTYTDFTLINIGGLKADGSNAVNELSYMILDVIEEMRLLQPGSMVQISEMTPNDLIHRALDIIKTGYGQPSLFNTDAIVKQLLRQGKSNEDARNGGASGCVESGAFGTESYILTGYFNLTKIFELTLFDGRDPRTGKQIGLKTGSAHSFSCFDELFEAFRKQLHYFIDIKITGNNEIERIFADHMPVPFLSLLIDDCISNGVDYNSGGARYNTSYIQGVGLGSLTDCMAAIKHHVFNKKTFSIDKLMAAVVDNFEDHTDLRFKLIYESPKYGNDNDFADSIAVDIFNAFFEAVDGRPTERGGKFRINMLPTTSHVYFGSVINALPDGRKAGEPLSEGISPFQGADSNGPTAVLLSAAKIDHIKTGGTLLNQKFTPDFFRNSESIDKLCGLVRGYFKMNGHHIQFNVVSANTLKDALKYPEKYRDLIVRVAGYSDYFNDLGEDLQNEIIRRTEHHLCLE